MPTYRKPIKKLSDAAEKAYLVRMYVERWLPPNQIAERIGLAPRTLYDRLKLHGIARPAVRHSEARKKFTPPAYCETCGHLLRPAKDKTEK